VKQVTKVQKEDPEQFEQIAKGKTTAKKALKVIKKKNQEATAKATKAKGKKGEEVAPGDLVYTVESYHPKTAGSPRIVALEVRSVDKDVYGLVGGKRLRKTEVFTLEEAKAERIKVIHNEIAELEEDLKLLKAALKKEPTIVPAKKTANQKG